MPEQLVIDGTRQYGRFAARPRVLNPLDQWSGARRGLRRLRLKEWIHFTLTHPDLFTSMAIQDAGYVASSEIYASLRADGKLHQHGRTGLGTSLHMPSELSGSRCRFVARGYELFYEFGGEHGDHRIEIRIGAEASGKELAASLLLHHAEASAPLSLSSQLPASHGANPAMYTHKRVFPVSGSYRVGEQLVRFDPARDLAVMDEHKSFLPYHTQWTWGTLASVDRGSILGANLISREELPGEEQEGCVWIDDTVVPLRDVQFERSGSISDVWQVGSGDGCVSLRFRPQGVKSVHRQLVVAEIDYHQVFGGYTGTLAGRRINDVHGVIEGMRARL